MYTCVCGQADEVLFVQSTDTSEPAYREVHGENRIFNRNGEEIVLNNVEDSMNKINNTNVELWRTGDIIPTRCPHGPSVYISTHIYTHIYTHTNTHLHTHIYIYKGACKMSTLIRFIKSEKDSIGGVITGVVHNPPPSLGEPVFDKMEASLAHAMMSIPATKGFEIGTGFEGTRLRGSVHNDMYKGFNQDKQVLETVTNNAGNVYECVCVWICRCVCVCVCVM